MESGQGGPLGATVAHRKLYKNPRGRTPPWKDIYRKRCMERLRWNRSQVVQRFRSSGQPLGEDDPTQLVQDVMEMEWAALNRCSNLLAVKKSLDGSEVEEEPWMSVMEEIQQELVNQEERLLVDIMKYDAAALANQVTLQQSEEVICPVCQVKSSLENTISHHGQTCEGQMSFTETTDTQGANVLITCSICDWMSFLL
nr:RPA-interacting protein A-like isoform X2 [Cherax quadricarinatus]